MKNFLRVLFVTLLLAGVNLALAEKPLAGPKGGRLLTPKAPHLEFLIGPDRIATIYFYDFELKPIGVEDQVVNAYARTKKSKVRIQFTAKEGVLVANTPMPEGDGYPVTVEARVIAGAKPAAYHFYYADLACPVCLRAQYACACEEPSVIETRKP